MGIFFAVDRTYLIQHFFYEKEFVYEV